MNGIRPGSYHAVAFAGDADSAPYYNQELLPKLRKAGGNQVPLAEVTPKIKELLIQKKMDELLTAWLHNLRAGSEIRAEALNPGSRGRSQ